MEGFLLYRMGLYQPWLVLHLLEYLPRPTLLGDALQLDSHWQLQELELHHQREGTGAAGFETHEEERL